MLEGRKMDNFSMRIYLETIESIVGSHGLKSVLNYAHLEKYIENFPPSDNRVEIPLEDLQNLCRSLLELFGKKGIRSLQLRVGQQTIRKSLEKHPVMMKLILPVRFLAPEHRRLQFALNKLIKVIEKSYPSTLDTSQGPRFELIEEEDCFIIISRDNWESEDVISLTPACHVTTGALKAFAEWTTGHTYEVSEIECRAAGHSADVFRISRSYEEEIEESSLNSTYAKKNLLDSIFRFRF